MYVPKYHQKLGCQANGGARAGRAPPRSTNVLFYTICPKISSKTRMPGKWGGRVPGAPPLDPPMYYFIQYVPKYHQKLGCQANGGRAPGAPPPPRSANECQSVKLLYKRDGCIFRSTDRSMNTVGSCFEYVASDDVNGEALSQGIPSHNRALTSD